MRLERIQAVVETIWLKLAAAQAAEFESSGRYWQGLPTHDDAPEGDTPAALGRHVEGRQSWAQFLPDLPDALDFKLEAHEYDGPLGKGFELLAFAAVEGETYLYRLHSGPEAHRDAGVARWTRQSLDTVKAARVRGG